MKLVPQDSTNRAINRIRTPFDKRVQTCENKSTSTEVIASQFKQISSLINLNYLLALLS